MKTLLSPILLIIGLSACTEQEPVFIRVTGRIMNTTDSLPVANKRYLLYQYRKIKAHKYIDKTQGFVTDSNGYFSTRFDVGYTLITLTWVGAQNYQYEFITQKAPDIGVDTLEFGTVYTVN